MGDGLSTMERRALGALDLDGLIALLRDLIAIPSLDGAETQAQRHVAAWMDAAGFETDVWPIDLEDLASHPAWCHEVDRDEAIGVVGMVGGSPAGGRSGSGRPRHDLLLDGHIDVVPAGDEAEWSASPWDPVVRDGRIYGRGAVDMKGGLCCALSAARAILDAGIPLSGRLRVASVVGEEDGGTGTLGALLRGHTAQGAVVMEPTRLRVVPAQAGSLMFRLVVRGLSAHGCVRQEGVSAAEKFLPLFAALRRLEAERCGVADGGDDGVEPAAAVAGDPHSALFAGYRLPWPIEVGTVRAGDWASSVPGTLVAEGRYGVAVGEEADAARRVFEDAVRRAAAADPWLAAHPPEVEWWGGRFDPAVTDPDDRVVAVVTAAARDVTGATPRVEGVTYGSDMRLLVNTGGIPTVLFGPGDVRVAHMPDEHVSIAELDAAARAIVVAAIRFCGVEQ